MKKILSFLTTIDSQNISNSFVKTVVIDLLTIGIGTIMLATSISGNHPNKDGITFGSSLLVFGILIKIWRKELKNE